MEEKDNLVEQDELSSLYSFDAVHKYKSARRAFRRSNATRYGSVVPKRPFNNRANTCKRGKHSRSYNELRKKIYGEIGL